jgi:hypothetical protein
LVHKRQRPEGIPRQRTLVQAGTLGFVRDVPWLGRIESGVGGGVTLYRFSAKLDSIYGRRPVSFQVFYRVRFASDAGMAGMDHSHMHMPM